ncbi:MAG: hypothetical protein ACJAR2_000761 [Ilumatobacter sp.]|jgi:hypothetical protein
MITAVPTATTSIASVPRLAPPDVSFCVEVEARFFAGSQSMVIGINDPEDLGPLLVLLAL